MTTTKTPDKHGNVIADEGCTRCACGAKYWEKDVCVSCGAPASDAPIVVARANTVESYPYDRPDAAKRHALEIGGEVVLDDDVWLVTA